MELILNKHVGCSKEQCCGNLGDAGVKGREMESGLTLNAVARDCTVLEK